MPKQTDHYQSWINIVTGLYVLVLLEREPAHGHKIASEIKRRTDGEMSPNPNSLYPLLRIMEERGFITGSWDNPETRGKRIYQITEEGIAYIPILRSKFKERLEQAERKLQILRCDLSVD